MAEAWIDFAALQRTLDEQGAAIIAKQTAGATSRKEVTARTKEFRKLPSDEDKLAQIKPLLKLYQTEIDSLVSRCKFVEQCFMDVYKSLADAPDPRHLLAAKDEEMASQEAKMAALEEKLTAANYANENLNTEITEKNQQLNTDAGGEMARELEKALLRAAQAEARNSSLRKELQSKGQVVDEEDDIDMDAVKRLADRDSELANLRSLLATEKTARHEAQTKLKQLQTAASNSNQSTISAQPSNDEEQRLDAASQSTQDDRAVLRRQLQIAEADREELKSTVGELESANAKHRTLIAQLEEDLANVHHNDSFSTISGWTAVPRRSLSPSASLAGPSSRAPSTAGGSVIGGGPGERDAMASIVVQQRDRFKKRCQELEEEQYKLQGVVTAVRKEIEVLKRDNAGLHERVRHLQSPSKAAPTSAGSAYEDLYRSLDAERALQHMNKADATICRALGKLIVDSRARYGLLTYLILVHFFAIY